LERYRQGDSFWGSIIPLAIIEDLDPKKNFHLGPQMALKVKTDKNSKLPKLSENSFKSVGKGGDACINKMAPISIWK
jgi:hypothetical protein